MVTETPEEKEALDSVAARIQNAVKNGQVDKGEKYKFIIRDRYTGNTLTVDVYDVLVAFGITCPAMQHAVKKVLMAGERGHKSFNADCDEAINSIEQSKLLRKWSK